MQFVDAEIHTFRCDSRKALPADLAPDPRGGRRARRPFNRHGRRRRRAHDLVPRRVRRAYDPSGGRDCALQLPVPRPPRHLPLPAARQHRLEHHAAGGRGRPAVRLLLRARRGRSILRSTSLPGCAAALLFGFFGASVAALVDPRPLAIAIALVIVGAGVYVLLPARPASKLRDGSGWREKSLLASVGAAAGFGSGFSGAGGPVFAV